MYFLRKAEKSLRAHCIKVCVVIVQKKVNISEPVDNNIPGNSIKQESVQF